MEALFCFTVLQSGDRCKKMSCGIKENWKDIYFTRSVSFCHSWVLLFVCLLLGGLYVLLVQTVFQKMLQ